MAIRPSTKLLAHIRRRPLVPLLLAATVCVDAVGIVTSTKSDPAAWITWMGLLLGQVSLLAMWTTSRWQAWMIRAGLLVLAVLGFGWFQGRLDINSGNLTAAWATFAGAYAISSALLALLVRLVVYRQSLSKRVWRFSMRAMVGLMTLVSILSALGMKSDLRHFQDDWTLILIVCEAMLGASSLFVALVVNSYVIAAALILTLAAIYAAIFFWVSGLPAQIYAEMFLFYIAASIQYVMWLLAVRVRCAPRWKHKPAR
jgi:hypothetical protein